MTKLLSWRVPEGVPSETPNPARMYDYLIGGYNASRPTLRGRGEALLEGDPLVGMIRAEARRLQEILGHSETLRLLDFEKPVALLMLCVLHFLGGDEEAGQLTRQMRNAPSHGSYMAVSHGERASG